MEKRVEGDFEQENIERMKKKTKTEKGDLNERVRKEDIKTGKVKLKDKTTGKKGNEEKGMIGLNEEEIEKKGSLKTSKEGYN